MYHYITTERLFEDFPRNSQKTKEPINHLAVYEPLKLCSCTSHIAIEICQFLFLSVVHHVHINVHCRRNIAMAKDGLNDLDIDTRLTEPCSERVSEHVAGKVR